MGSLWGHFGIILAVTLGSLGGHFGIILKFKFTKKTKFRNFRRRPIQSMRNDLTKTMDMTIWPETHQKGMFLRKYMFGVWPGGMRVALGIRPDPCGLRRVEGTKPKCRSRRRICFREAKYAAIAPSAGPPPGHRFSMLRACFAYPPFSSFSFDVPCILLHFAA